MALHSYWILLWAMSLVTVHTISVNKQPDDKLVALNTSMISQLQEAEGHAYFKFAPKANRAFWYLVKEDMAFVLSAIHDTTAFDITLSTTGGNVTLSTDDIVMAYLHPSEDRIWVQYNYSGNIQLLVAKYRLDDFIKLVNTQALYQTTIFTAVKTADTAKVNDDTFAPDPHLYIALGANSYYTLDVFLLTNAHATPDIKIRFGAMAGAIIYWTYTFALAATPKTGIDSNPIGGTGVDKAGTIMGVVYTTNAVTLTFEWAQNVSDANASSILKGSWIKCVKL